MIPFSEPNLTELERGYLADAYDSSWIGGKGDFIDKFEEKFSKYIGVGHAITCSSGTAALFLSYLACGMKTDSKVITTVETFAATYNMANVISRDVKMIRPNSESWNLNPVPVDNCDFFIGVHLYGNPLDMGSLYKSKYTFIEDCAQSLGSEFKGKKAGSFGNVGCFSFHSSKTITTGEGGMCVTNDKEIADKIRHLKNQAMLEPYKHDQLGWNFRMTNLQAAIGLAQFERIDELIANKVNISKFYNENLSKKFKRQEDTRKSKIVKWANAYSNPYASLIRQKLKESGIDTRPGFNREDIIVFPCATTLTQSNLELIVKEANSD